MTADEVRAAATHLQELHQRFAPLFGTRPAQEHALSYLRGLLLHEGRKNTEAIALEGVAIVSATVEPPSQQRVRHTYTLQLPDAARLPRLMRAMRNVPGVYDVSRAQHQAAAPQ